MRGAIGVEPVERSIQQLNNILIGNDGSKIQIAFSKQNYLSKSTNLYSLPDNSISFKVYSTSKNNRFPGQQKSHSPLLQYPTRMLSEDLLLIAFTTMDCHPSQVRMFPLKSESAFSGLVEFPSVALAVNAIMNGNHSSSKTMNGAWSNGNT
ncbi:uncharacterized protein LOC135710061 [Ochlerotatus camptorhynchus]|uniref:uncharacterized protein LOC135710061 n=1 Tax=Ochlerotatus camptorhynchus TaxID=644619 RepID=UPI0031E46A51